MEGALSTLAQTAPGAIIVLLVGAVIWLAQKLVSVQEARISDAKKVAEDALKREDKWHGSLGELTDAVERLLERSSGAPRGGRQ